jgi:hypothetical protein
VARECAEVRRVRRRDTSTDIIAQERIIVVRNTNSRNKNELFSRDRHYASKNFKSPAVGWRMIGPINGG